MINKLCTTVFLLFSILNSYAQLIINEGSNKNYSLLPDEEGEYEDWIEIYNAGNTAIDLKNYSLSDNANPGEWVFPHQIIQPNEFLLVFCDGKNRNYASPFTLVLTDTTFQPQTGWNNHRLNTPFYWDGLSNIILNICTFNPFWTNNSLHLQTATNYISSVIALMDGGSACGFITGGTAMQRPNIRFNNIISGNGALMNGYTDYPSAYSNWYGSARQQYLFKADELSAAGLSPGFIDSLAFDVVAPCPTDFDLLEISLSTTGVENLNTLFVPQNGNNNHTNFKISSSGETISLYNPANVLISSLNIDCGPGYDVSSGCSPDASSVIKKFSTPSPGSSNNNSNSYNNFAIAPVFSALSGIVSTPFNLTLFDGNTPNGNIYYTLDGSEPDTSSLLWSGNPIYINQSTVVRARTFLNGSIPSTISSASFLFNIQHSTAIISVITDPNHLFGPNGMFDNYNLDLLKPACVEVYDSLNGHPLIYSGRSGLIMDGGWGSRGQPQKPFRIKFDDGVLGQGPVNEKLLTDRPDRTRYSDLYLANGGGNYLILPFKDAAQTKMLAKETNNHYAASRPFSVYINGQYWGLYDGREKFNTEMFEIYDQANENSIEIMGSSAQYNFQLRAIEGNLDNFYNSYQAFSQLNPADTNFWTQANQYFDLEYYHDYMIAELWMNNADWCFNYNNLKIYRSDATDYRWRYILMDLEYGLLPNLSNDFNCQYDLLGQLIQHQASDPGNPHFNIFWKGMQNHRFKNYFINRFADQMNTVYQSSKMISVWNNIYNLTLPEMSAHYARWGDPNNIPAQINAYDQYSQLFQNELLCRPEYAREYIQNNFNLPQQVHVNLEVFPANTGTVNINTVRPDFFPWTGIYFDGVPVKITAQPLPGFAFSHWDVNGLIADSANPVFLDTINIPNVNFKAHFKSTTGLGEIGYQFINAFPNPTADEVFLNLNSIEHQIIQISITDLSGRSFEPECSMDGKTIKINTENFSKGYYIVHCKTKTNHSYRSSFMKQ